MRTLAAIEVDEVSGGDVAPWQEVAGGAIGGALTGFWAGARTGNLAFAVGMGVFGGAIGGGVVMIKYALY
jgi:hypothetical protein